MPFPVGLQTVTVTAGPYVDPTGVPVGGTVFFTPEWTLVHEPTASTVVSKTVPVTIDPVTGIGQVVLPASDSIGLTRTNFRYLVTFSLASGVAADLKPFYAVLPAASPTVDLDTLVPATGVDGSVVSLPTVTSVAGQTGSVTAAELADALDDDAGRLSDVALRAAFVPGSRYELTPVRDGVVFEDCLDATGWTKSGGGSGTVVAAAGDARVPNVLRYTTTAQASYEIARETWLTVPKGGALSMWVKRDANLSQLIVRVSVGAYGFSRAYRMSMGVGAIPVGTWYRLVIPLSSFPLNFTPPANPVVTDFAAVKGVSVRIIPTGGTDTVLDVGPMRVHGNPDPTPKIVWQFDDGRLDTYTTAFPILTAAGYSGFVAPEYDQVIANNAARCSLAQLKEMNAAGWEVGGHHITNLTTVSTAQAETILRECRDWLGANFDGRGASHWIWPGGGWNDAVDAVARRYFRTRRKVNSQALTALPHVYDPCDIPVRYVQAAQPLSQLQGNIDTLAEFGGTMVLDFHSIVADGATAENWLTADFQALVSYAKTRGVKGVTMDATFGSFKPPA